MTRSTMLGTASLVMLFVSFLGSAHLTFALTLAVLACMLGILAAIRGSRWWLSVPGIIVVWAAIMLLMAMQSS